ncbi:MAG: 3-phosphoshikimate 1-carboxyvinyltransferase [Planctomycetota bacterium]
MSVLLPLTPCRGPVTGTVRTPGSKSITNRALVCAALSRGTSTLTGVLDSQDTRVMAAGLTALGIAIEPDWPADRIVVHGSGGRIPATAATLDCAASGTTMRFLAAVCGIGSGSYRLDGTARMRKRPIGDLLAALRRLGVEATAESPGECPPVVIRSTGLAGGATVVDGGTSSQFASGLAMAGPCMPRGLDLEFAGTLVSTPYLEMTRRVMEAFGATCTVTGPRSWRIEPGGYAAGYYAIEPDASAASYFLAAAALTGGAVTVAGLGPDGLQGDVAFADALGRMGCRVTHDAAGVTVAGRATRGIDIDMNAISDTVPTLAVVALFADGPTTIRNVAHVRDKETDRIGDLVRELARLGADVSEHADGLTIRPRPVHGAVVETYDDHRMAMSLALAGLTTAGVVIADPGCVAKTFPGYWRALARLARLDTAAWPEVATATPGE